jgi:hypothetical protein
MGGVGPAGVLRPQARRLGACLSIPRGRERDGFAFSRGGADEVGYVPMRRRQRRMKANPSAPEGLALQGASGALGGGGGG